MSFSLLHHFVSKVLPFTNVKPSFMQHKKLLKIKYWHQTVPCWTKNVPALSSSSRFGWKNLVLGELSTLVAKWLCFFRWENLTSTTCVFKGTYAYHWMLPGSQIFWFQLYSQSSAALLLKRCVHYSVQLLPLRCHHLPPSLSFWTFSAERPPFFQFSYVRCPVFNQHQEHQLLMGRWLEYDCGY